VANRVWTTERSSANPSTIARSAALTTGESSAPTMAIRFPSCTEASQRITSVVVPLREMAMATA
jgi:hypothetical protein